jgi:hypothetical protein
MTKVRITQPLGPATKPQAFLVTGTGGGVGSQIECRISNSSHNQSVTTTVKSNGTWTAQLGVPTLIPVGTGYTILATLQGTSEDSISENITITDQLPIEMGEQVPGGGIPPIR